MNTRSTSRWVEGQFGSEFPAICNHCVVMTFWSRKTWQFCEKFFKTTSYGKIIQNFVPKVYMATPIDGVLSKCRKICPTGNRRNRALFTGQKEQNFGCISNCRYCADRAQNLLGPFPNNVLTVLQISFNSVHFRRSYSRTREHRLCPVDKIRRKLCFALGRIIIRWLHKYFLIFKR